MGQSLEDGLVVDDGYGINLGDDDDELLIMSKQKGKKDQYNFIGSSGKNKHGKGNDSKTKAL